MSEGFFMDWGRAKMYEHRIGNSNTLYLGHVRTNRFMEVHIGIVTQFIPWKFKDMIQRCFFFPLYSWEGGKTWEEEDWVRCLWVLLWHPVHLSLTSGVPSECPRLPSPNNGHVKYTKEGRSVGASVWYLCKDGYTLVGEESRTCLKNLTWSSNAPSCKCKCSNDLPICFPTAFILFISFWFIHCFQTIF